MAGCRPFKIPMLKTISTSSPLGVSAEQASQLPRQNGAARIVLRRAFLLVCCAAMLLWVAIYNGYPTVTPDSGNYIRSGAFHVALFPFRAPGYAVFTRWTSLATSAWYTIIAQAIIVVHVLRETFVHLIGREHVDRSLLAVVCALSALTSLPWFVSQLMPDIFTGVLFLCVFLLGFADEFHVARKSVLALIMMLSVAAHTSLFPIAAVYVVVVVAAKLSGRKTESLASTRSVVAWLLVPIILAGLWTATQNRKMGLGFRLSPSKNAFLLGRLFGDGLAPDFLRANCPTRSFISCRYLSNLPRDEEAFLFGHPLLQALNGHDDEISAIVHGTIAAYPRRFLLSSLQQTLFQLVTLRTGGNMRLHPASDGNFYDLRFSLPGDIPAFGKGRQLTDRMFPLTNAIAPVNTAIFWISFVACALFARTGRFAPINKVFVMSIVFLVVNAAVCGAFAGVYDRYQSRVAWLMPLCLSVYICSFLKARRREFVFQDATCR